MIAKLDQMVGRQTGHIRDAKRHAGGFDGHVVAQFRQRDIHNAVVARVAHAQEEYFAFKRFNHRPQGVRIQIEMFTKPSDILIVLFPERDGNDVLLILQVESVRDGFIGPINRAPSAVDGETQMFLKSNVRYEFALHMRE